MRSVRMTASSGDMLGMYMWIDQSRPDQTTYTYTDRDVRSCSRDTKSQIHKAT